MWSQTESLRSELLRHVMVGPLLDLEPHGLKFQHPVIFDHSKWEWLSCKEDEELAVYHQEAGGLWENISKHVEYKGSGIIVPLYGFSRLIVFKVMATSMFAAYATASAAAALGLLGAWPPTAR